MTMVSIEIAFLIISILLILSVVASKFSDRFGIPALLIFLIIGMLAGSEGLGGIYFDDPVIAQAVGLVALTIILFSGGLDTNWEDIHHVIKESLLLAILGTFLTACIFGLIAHFILGIPILESLLMGAIMSSTDAAAVFSMLHSRGIRLKGKLPQILEFESGSNDPMAVFMTIGLIHLIQMPQEAPTGLIFLFFQQMTIGCLFGLLFGQILIFLINRLRLGYDGLYPILVLGILFLTFASAALLNGSGFLAVYLVGLTLGKTDFLHKRSLSRFYDGFAWLFQIIMFLTMGLLVFPSKLLPVMLPGLFLSVILIFIARPISVWISLLPFHFSAREKTLLSWMGLRGAVPIILATYPRLAGLDQSDMIFNIVFFVVLTSTLIQGSNISWVARRLNLIDTSEVKPLYPLEINTNQGWKGILREVVVKTDSPIIGKAIFELKLPRDYLVVLVARGDKFFIPNGSIVLQADDRMLGLALLKTHEQVARIMTQEQDG